MSLPKPRDVYDQPLQYWDFITHPSDDHFEGQHFDRKEIGRPDANGVSSNSSIQRMHDHIRSTVSAFANSNKDGGLLILGISKIGEILGINHIPEKTRNTLLNLSRELVHHNSEIKNFDCQDSQGKNKTIALILSNWSTTGICETIGDQPKAWTRSGAQCVAINRQMRDTLLSRKGLINNEINPLCRFDPDELDKDVLNQFRKVYLPDNSDELDDIRLLKEAGAIVKKDGDFWFTVPGLLFFGYNPQQFIPYAYIRLLRFGVIAQKYSDRGAPNFNKEFKGSITSQIRAARTYFRDSGFFSRFQKRDINGGFIEEPELPPIAIDEAIVNSVVHRDYAIQLPIECEAYLDTFIVKNPGRIIQRSIDLPDHFRLNTTTLDSMPRNSKLLEWLKLMRDSDGKAFVQAISEGTKRMNQEMLNLNLPAPEFILTESESLLKLVSNAKEREEAILASMHKVKSTESINFYPITARKGSDLVMASELRGKKTEFMLMLRNSLENCGWYIDRFSFSRLTTHRKNTSLPYALNARDFVRFYPSYSLQLQEAFGRHYLSIDFVCEVLNIKKLDQLVNYLPIENLIDINCVAHYENWEKGKIIEVNNEWAKIYFFDKNSEKIVATSDVIPNLSIKAIEQVLKKAQIQVDLPTEIKRASLSSEKGAARLRSEKIQFCAEQFSKNIFPMSFGEYEVDFNPIRIVLMEHIAGSDRILKIQRLNEPTVEFRNHHASSDVREGITKFGAYDREKYKIEIIPICLISQKIHMENLLYRLMEGKFKYKGAERTFSTRFLYTTILTVDSINNIQSEIERLLTQNPEWIGDSNLNRIFLIHCPEGDFSLDDEKSPYYMIKKFLLEAGIPCQMINTNTLQNPDWKDLNLSLNITTKCGVTPWVLPERIPDADFFIGLSYTQSRTGQRIMGFANVFNNYGCWEFYTGNTTAFPIEARPLHLAILVENVLKRLKQKHSLPASSNLVIHHSVRISKEDCSAILNAARSIEPEISITFVWVNNQSNIRLFDSNPKTDGSVRRGSFISTSKRTVLLSTTGSNPYRQAIGTPKPLELTALHFKSSSNEPTNYDERSLAIQVLSLTKLNWASTDSFCGEPITIKYAGDIAYLTAAFERQGRPFKLHTVLERTPWFI